MNSRYGLGFGLVICFCVLLFLGVKLIPNQQFVATTSQPTELTDQHNPTLASGQPVPFQPLTAQARDVEFPGEFQPDPFATVVTELNEPRIQQTQAEEPPSIVGQLGSDPSPPEKFGGAAAPLADNNEEKKKIVRDGLPNASEEERQVWLEELQGLPPEAIRDLLRLRSKVGRPSFFPSVPKTAPKLPKVVANPLASDAGTPSLLDLSIGMDERLLPSIKALRSARDVILNNLTNATSHGFRRSRPVLMDSSYANHVRPGRTDQFGNTSSVGVHVGRGVELASTQLDMATGELERTGKPFDLAIEGDGFFQVQSDGETLYTRCGRLTVNQTGQLVLAISKMEIALTPAIAVPEGWAEIQVQPDGSVESIDAKGSHTDIGVIEIVRFMNPAGLQVEGACLFSATDASAAASTTTEGKIRQGYLERSNVDPQAELIELKRIKRLLSSLEEAQQILAPTPDPTPIPTPRATPPQFPTAVVPAPVSRQ